MTSVAPSPRQLGWCFLGQAKKTCVASRGNTASRSLATFGLTIWLCAGCGNDQPPVFSPVEYQRPEVIPWPSAAIPQPARNPIAIGQVAESVRGEGGIGGASLALPAVLGKGGEGGCSSAASQGGGAEAPTGYTGAAGGALPEPPDRPEMP